MFARRPWMREGCSIQFIEPVGGRSCHSGSIDAYKITISMPVKQRTVVPSGFLEFTVGT